MIDEHQICANYRAGSTLDELQTKHGCGKDKLRVILRSNGIQMRHGGPRRVATGATERTIKGARALKVEMAKGYTLREVAKNWRISRKSLEYIKKVGVENGV